MFVTTRCLNFRRRWIPRLLFGAYGISSRYANDCHAGIDAETCWSGCAGRQIRRTARRIDWTNHPYCDIMSHTNQRYAGLQGADLLVVSEFKTYRCNLLRSQ